MFLIDISLLAECLFTNKWMSVFNRVYILKIESVLETQDNCNRTRTNGHVNLIQSNFWNKYVIEGIVTLSLQR